MFDVPVPVMELNVTEFVSSGDGTERGSIGTIHTLTTYSTTPPYSSVGRAYYADTACTNPVK